MIRSTQCRANSGKQDHDNSEDTPIQLLPVFRRANNTTPGDATENNTPVTTHLRSPSAGQVGGFVLSNLHASV
eukprot:261332-Prorocentrum_minimum.AAC.1